MVSFSIINVKVYSHMKSICSGIQWDMESYEEVCSVT